MRICGQCQHENAAEALYCARCGSGLQGADDTADWKKGDTLHGGAYVVEALQGGVSDIDGNALDATFTATFTTAGR